ncbi:unnamed protein product [Paramecium octaurelia]|uniref:Uncharacterized protein n=1 Tax=Paramecium octaurelia TaxID=43137 RepID=A0A8S1TBR9_PAROT|nr:unnamed protein product [Paramecium octaurelia]
MKCRFHVNQQLKWIYTANGPLQANYENKEQKDVQKKLQFVLNEIPPKNVLSQIQQINSSILPFETFKEQLKQILNINTQQSSLTDLRESIKKMQKQINQTCDWMFTILSEIEQQNISIQNCFKLEDEEFLFSNISKDKIRILAQAIENNLAQQWQEWLNKCLKGIQEAINKLKRTSDDFEEIIKVYKEEKDQKLIEVKEVCGIKYGEQNYIINGSIVLAGRYFANNPSGLWHECGKQQPRKNSNFQILYMDYLMKYMKDGVILKILPYYQMSNTIENIEKLKYFEEKGYVKQNKKSGLQLCYWKGECLNSGGIYNKQGNKDGSWKELHDNYQDNSQVIFSKNYSNGIQLGEQQIIFDEEIIGKGTFKEGEKDGYWTEIHEKFCRDLQIIEKGNYKNGRKIKEWQIYLKNKKIGGGEYDENGNKIKMWSELHECYNVDSRVFYCGNYNEGKKVGGWKIKDNDEQLGGGSYLDGFKVGEWTEISGNFLKSGELTISYGVYFKGAYEMGKKKDQWMFKNDNIYEIQGEYINGLKHGDWTELSTNFNESEQIFAKGKYEKGLRIGDWKIFRNSAMIGGGTYNNGKKVDDWIELDENFEQSIILLKGRYNLEGLKSGVWIIYDGLENVNQKEIGRGSYNDQQLKNGNWIEIYDYCNDSRVLFEGEYQNGIRVSQWNILEIETNSDQNRTIGGGEFDNLGRKNGTWIELDKHYFSQCKVRYQGDYRSGRKSGKWKAIYFHYMDQRFQVIGQYDENGMKTGQWTELHHYFSDLNQITLKGSYSEGIKQGTWKICKRDRDVDLGSYDKNGLKHGQFEMSETLKESIMCNFKNGIRQS